MHYEFDLHPGAPIPGGESGKGSLSESPKANSYQPFKSPMASPAEFSPNELRTGGWKVPSPFPK